MMEKSAIAIGVAVVQFDFEPEDLFLVGERPPGAHLAGAAEFPGGKVQAGELPEAAAVRECLEETGLGVALTESLGIRVQHYQDASVQLCFFLCHVAGTNPGKGLLPPLDPPAVPPPWRWAPRSELLSLPFPAGNQVVVQHLAQGPQ